MKLSTVCRVGSKRSEPTPAASKAEGDEGLQLSEVWKIVSNFTNSTKSRQRMPRSGIVKESSYLNQLKIRGKTKISNAGLLKRVFQKLPGASGRVRVPPGPQQD